MMRHKEIEELIQKKLDNEIMKDEEGMLIQHLNQCPECQEYFYGMERIKNILEGLIEYFPSDNFNECVMAEIGIKQQRVWLRLIPVFWGIYLATLLILLLTPLKTLIFSKILLSTPMVLNVLRSIAPLINGFTNFAQIFIKLNLPPLFAGLILSIPIFYAFIRILKREEKWRPQNSY